MKDICKFQFDKGISDELIESQIFLALKKTTQIFGETRVLFSTSYCVAEGKAIIDITYEVGQRMAQEFYELMIDKAGLGKFTIKRSYIGD